MALFKDPDFVARVDDSPFDMVSAPGDVAPFAGVYRCTNCGEEIGTASGQPLPDHGRAPHQPECDRVQWKLLVVAQQRRPV